MTNQVARDNKIQATENFIRAHADQEFNLVKGTEKVTYKLGDIKYKPSVNNWVNTKTSGFMRKEILDEIIKQVKARTQVARACLSIDSIKVPTTYKEAMESDEKNNWIEGMEDEIASLQENEVYQEVPRSQVNKKTVGSRWVFALKRKPDGEIDKFKARVVAKGYSQVYGVDYTETYCSVVQMVSFRLLLSYAAMIRLKIKQFDIKTAFLYGDLNEEIFMEPPEGYGKEDLVWHLKRSLYGLKQSPRMWNEKFMSFIVSLGFKVSDYDQSVFIKFSPIVFIIVYVDDGLIFYENEEDGQEVINQLSKRFKMRELEVNVYRGIEIKQNKLGIFISQENYANKVLETFNMLQAKPAANPVNVLDESRNEPLAAHVPFRSAVGSLAYLADMTRPDISYAVNQLARRLTAPTQNDWIRVKQVMRYIKATTPYGIWYPSMKTKEVLTGYSDSDFAGDKESSKSRTGYIVSFNSSAVHWKTQLQKHTTLSSTEAEVIALCALSKEMAWIRRMCVELQVMSNEAALLKCDNTSAIKIAQSERATQRTRHLRAQEGYIREQLSYKEIQLVHVPSNEQLADMLTKGLQTHKFITDRDCILKSKHQVFKQAQE